MSFFYVQWGNKQLHQLNVMSEWNWSIVDRSDQSDLDHRNYALIGVFVWPNTIKQYRLVNKYKKYFNTLKQTLSMDHVNETNCLHKC